MKVLPITSAQRTERFGRFRTSLDPTPGNPEHVRILDGWAEANLVSIHVPQLPGRLLVLHVKAVGAFTGFLADVEKAGLLPLIHTYNGSWAPRFKRQAGSVEERIAKCRTLGPQNLSNHAWGTAMDFDAGRLPLGAPVSPSEPFLGLEPLANARGIFWGGRFKSRVDAMHFEIGTIAP